MFIFALSRSNSGKHRTNKFSGGEIETTQSPTKNNTKPQIYVPIFMSIVGLLKNSVAMLTQLLSRSSFFIPLPSAQRHRRK